MALKQTEKAVPGDAIGKVTAWERTENADVFIDNLKRAS
jgi:hypothetical protein